MSGKLARISARKVEANRQNALRSTGPKTSRGKAYSRRNALKHGLFAMDLFSGRGARRENSEKYQELLDRLAEEYQPVGIAESLEVERIAACWWKLGRAWRYENSEICFEHAAIEATYEDLISPLSDTPMSPEHVTLALLRRAEAEIGALGKISDQLKGEMVAANPRFQQVWAMMEQLTQKQFGDFLAEVSAENRQVPTVPDCSNKFLVENIQLAIYIIEHRLMALVEDAARNAFDTVAVPKPEVLDRLLRADAAAERNLNRAIDRLERLQRRRQGEAVPPPVSVRLSR